MALQDLAMTTHSPNQMTVGQQPQMAPPSYNPLFGSGQEDFTWDDFVEWNKQFQGKTIEELRQDPAFSSMLQSDTREGSMNEDWAWGDEGSQFNQVTDNYWIDPRNEDIKYKLAMNGNGTVDRIHRDSIAADQRRRRSSGLIGTALVGGAAALGSGLFGAGATAGASQTTAQGAAAAYGGAGGEFAGLTASNGFGGSLAGTTATGAATTGAASALGGSGTTATATGAAQAAGGFDFFNPSSWTGENITNGLSGWANSGGLGSLLSSAYQANRNNQTDQDLQALYEPYRQRANSYYDRLDQTYDDPSSYLQGPEFQAVQDTVHNQLSRADAARGGNANDIGRAKLLQDHAFANLGNYRQGLSSTAGTLGGIATGQNSNNAMLNRNMTNAPWQDFLGSFQGRQEVQNGGQQVKVS